LPVAVGGCCWVSYTAQGSLIFSSQNTISANQKVKLVINNQDNTPEELDSFSLKRDKVIFANNKAIIFFNPPKPSKYKFLGEYNPNTACGIVIVIVIVEH
jgi:hypothetical protein